MCSSTTTQMESTPEPPPGFYQWGIRPFFGNLYWHWVASVAYVVVVTLPVLALWLKCDLNSLAAAHPTALLLWAMLTSIAYPLWALGEFRAFNEWVRKQGEEARSRERAYFTAVTAATRNFWTGVLATYTIAGVWQLALR